MLKVQRPSELSHGSHPFDLMYKCCCHSHIYFQNLNNYSHHVVPNGRFFRIPDKYINIVSEIEMSGQNDSRCFLGEFTNETTEFLAVDQSEIGTWKIALPYLVVVK